MVNLWPASLHISTAGTSWVSCQKFRSTSQSCINQTKHGLGHQGFNITKGQVYLLPAELGGPDHLPWAIPSFYGSENLFCPRKRLQLEGIRAPVDLQGNCSALITAAIFFFPFLIFLLSQAVRCHPIQEPRFPYIPPSFPLCNSVGGRHRHEKDQTQSFALLPASALQAQITAWRYEVRRQQEPSESGGRVMLCTLIKTSKALKKFGAQRVGLISPDFNQPEVGRLVQLSGCLDCLWQSIRSEVSPSRGGFLPPALAAYFRMR